MTLTATSSQLCKTHYILYLYWKCKILSLVNDDWIMVCQFRIYLCVYFTCSWMMAPEFDWVQWDLLKQKKQESQQVNESLFKTVLRSISQYCVTLPIQHVCNESSSVNYQTVIITMWKGWEYIVYSVSGTLCIVNTCRMTNVLYCIVYVTGLRRGVWKADHSRELLDASFHMFYPVLPVKHSSRTIV